MVPGYKLNTSDWRLGQVLAFREQSNEPLGLIKGGLFLC